MHETLSREEQFSIQGQVGEQIARTHSISDSERFHFNAQAFVAPLRNVRTP